MQGDHNSERFTFELPRYVDGHDMSLCNRVIVHFDNVGDSVMNAHSDVAYTDDLRLNSDNPETVICSWLIRREATQIVGILSFSLQYLCVEDDGSISYEWNTDSYDDIEIRKSKQNGEAAVIQYTNVLEQWRSQIFSAGDSVMANISTEGANQVTAVQNESATQQAAIELKGSETLATIPDDYTEVYNMAEEALRTKADGVVCEAEGEVITVCDSANDHIRRLNVYGKTTQATTTGKNLLPILATTGTSNGITYTVYDDGHIHVKGTAAANSWLWVPVQNGDERLAHIPAGTYFLSGTPGGNGTGYINGWYADGTAIPQHNDTGSGKRVKLERDAYVYYQIMVATGTVVDGDFYPQLEVGESATAFEPYTGGVASPNTNYPQELVSIENPTVSIYGNNIFDVDAFVNNALNNGVLTAIQKAENGIQVMVKSYLENLTKYDFGFEPDTQYTISFDAYWDNATDDTAQLSVLFYYTDGTNTPVTINYIDGTKTYTVASKSGKTVASIAIGTWRYAGLCILRNISLVKGSYDSITMPAYEACTPQSLALTNTLRGIPVTSGGNYTDSDGQQWICDEVDLERGVRIQRIERLMLDGSYDWNLYNYQTQYYGFHIWDILDEQHNRSNGMCNQFKIVGGSDGDCLWVGVMNQNIYAISKDWYDKGVDAWKAHLNETPLEIIYARITPIEMPLTAEEIKTYKSLKTNYPNTTVINNAGAMMNIKYNADTKLYIAEMADNRAASLVEEVLNDTY